MKYVILLGDGMADYPVPELGGSTPLEVAEKPNMDFLAQHGWVGMVKTVPEGMAPGSDVANLAVLGYNPEIYYTGRSPLEAASMGVILEENDVAFRCNLVTLSEEEADYDARQMVDYSSDEITSEEAAELLKTVAGELGTDRFEFYPGISYRHLMVWRGGIEEVKTTPPHDITGKVIGSFLPRGTGSERLRRMMMSSYNLLLHHPVNEERRRRGLRPANSIWLWGQGKKPALLPFYRKYGLQAAMVSAVDLTKGIGVCAGMRVVQVEGATGNIHTNFRGKALAALECLRDGIDLVYIHVEAPDEAGHRGELETKIRAIEAIDSQVLKPLLEGLDAFPDYKLLLLPDHPTPLSVRTHVGDPVPFVIYQKSKTRKSGVSSYSEENGRSQEWLIEKGYTLMDVFLGEMEED